MKNLRKLLLLMVVLLLAMPVAGFTCVSTCELCDSAWELADPELGFSFVVEDRTPIPSIKSLCESSIKSLWIYDFGDPDPLDGALHLFDAGNGESATVNLTPMEGSWYAESGGTAINLGENPYFGFLFTKGDSILEYCCSETTTDEGDFVGFNLWYPYGVMSVLAYDVKPVPVPAAVWLLGSGLFGLVAVRRRKS